MKNLTKQEFEYAQIKIHSGTIVPRISLNNQCASCCFDKNSFGCELASNNIGKIKPGYCGKYTNFIKYENNEDIDYNDHFYKVRSCKKRKLNI